MAVTIMVRDLYRGISISCDPEPKLRHWPRFSSHFGTAWGGLSPKKMEADHGHLSRGFSAQPQLPSNFRAQNTICSTSSALILGVEWREMRAYIPKLHDFRHIRTVGFGSFNTLTDSVLTQGFSARIADQNGTVSSIRSFAVRSRKGATHETAGGALPDTLARAATPVPIAYRCRQHSVSRHSIDG